MSKTKYPNKGWIAGKAIPAKQRLYTASIARGRFVLTDDVTKHPDCKVLPGPKPLDSEIDWHVFKITPQTNTSDWRYSHDNT